MNLNVKLECMTQKNFLFCIAQKKTCRAFSLCFFALCALFMNGKVLAQDYSGYYYINSNYNTSYYICPSGDECGLYYNTPNQPYLTTYQTGQVSGSVWRLQKTTVNEVDYYYVIHHEDGKYLTYNEVMGTGTSADSRIRVHLQASPDPDGNSLFLVNMPAGQTYYTISPKNDSNRSLNPAGNNYNSYCGTSDKTLTINGQSVNVGGLIGLWGNNDERSRWRLNDATPDAPSAITYDYLAKTIAITHPTPNEVTIRYTLDGTDPTTNSAVYTSPISYTSTSPCTIKAIAEKNGVCSEVIAYYLQRVAKPTIYDNGDYHIHIACQTEGATILFTTDGSNPDPAHVGGNNPTQQVPTDGLLGPEYSGLAIKALAVKTGMITSNINERVVTLRCPTPTFSIDHTNGNVAIVCPGDASATIYYTYTTDGSTPADPTTASTNYSTTPLTLDPSTMTAAAQIKAIAVHTSATPPSFNTSFVGSASYQKVAEPVISMSNLFQVTLTCSTTGSSIYYTTDGTAPTVASTLYTGPFSNTAGNPIKAIAVKTGMVPSEIAESETFRCAKPIITHIIENGVHKFRITGGNFPEGANFTFRYTTDGTDPTTSSTLYAGPVVIDVSSSTVTVKAIAILAGYETSLVSTKTMTANLGGTGQTGDPYIIASDGDFDLFVFLANTEPTDNFMLAADVSAAGSESITTPFQGMLEGSYDNNTGIYHKISDLDHPLFTSINGATVRDIVLDNVSISSGDSNGDVGAIACYAYGASRIYNCGVLATIRSTISGSRNVGCIVGLLNGSSRVINCYSFADITGGATKGGIVGNNNCVSHASNLTTMVMNCMFYGDIASGGNISPVYGGRKISNDNGNTNPNGAKEGVNNYNYFRFDAPYFDNITEYNCALAAEERYLDRFEFFRLMLNSNRDLAAFYVDPNPTALPQNGRAGGGGEARYNTELIAKWVLDLGIAPYPILKAPSTASNPRVYPSVVNYDPVKIFDPETGAMVNRPDANASGYQRNQGGVFGTLSVNIQDPAGSGKPTGATLTTSSLALNIIDKDTANFNYNYYKVQLPYYNSVGTGNYTHNKVVTGWKIVSVTTDGHVTYNNFTTGNDAPAYNFADRYCIDKDLFSVSGRVFSQGAYYDVPEGVTAITIEPYWGNAVYLSDARYDYVYPSNYQQNNSNLFLPAGKRYAGGEPYSINGDNQIVYTASAKATEAIRNLQDQALQGSSKTVYDYAIVLVGNYHYYYGGNTFTGDNTYPLTVMSADLDFDNEPDFSFVYQHGNNRVIVAPLRFDFINLPGIGMVQKVDGTIRNPEVGIFWSRGWFEVTNTCVIRFNQIEYNVTKTLDSPLILLGGICEQIVSRQGSEDNGQWHTTYLHLGSNAWFQEFSNGTHGNYAYSTRHQPISVTGGDYDKFYLSGMFNPAANVYSDNAECYINGGRFGEMAGAGMEKIDGNVTWLIDHADIREFYGGGINAVKNISGTIDITVDNSYVGQYCAGPKFGNMEVGKDVTTHATGSVFGRYYGAGYGGTSYYREKPHEDNNVNNGSSNTINNENTWWNDWTNSYERRYTSGKGISTNHEYEYFQYSGGGADRFVGRFYVNYASLTLSTTHTVRSYLTDCEVMTDYYGGGCLGYVDNNAYSTLTDCTIHGNVFGGGFSAENPTLRVMNTGHYVQVPHYNPTTGIFEPAEFPASVVYTWKQADAVSAGHEFEDNGDEHFILTTTDMTHLGQVRGSTYVTVNGNTIVEGMIDGEPIGGVFGAGNASAVLGNATVLINTNNEDEQYAINNVYGGGNVAVTGNPDAAVGENNGNTFVTIQSGLIGKMEDGNLVDGTGRVFAGGKGGVDPTAPENGKHLGDVYGNTTLTLHEGGYVRGNLYGGGRYSNVGRTTLVDGLDVPVPGTGHATIVMDGGEVGFERDLELIATNPNLCYIFGGGMGDPATNFNTWTNVNSTEVLVTGGHVWGSVFGGGEEGHVLGSIYLHIGGNALIGNGSATDGVEGIGGTSAVDGNIFGGGRGYRAVALTAGSVGGNIDVEIDGHAIMLGSVYGGGRIGSVGTYFCAPNDSRYGKMQPGDGHGYITVSIGGDARIGTEHKSHPYTGHVYGGCMGSVVVDGTSPIWPRLGRAKGAIVTVNGSAHVFGDVYGGSMQGSILENTIVNIGGDAVVGSYLDENTPGAQIYHNPVQGETGESYASFGSVFGGGRGYSDEGFDDDGNEENEPAALISGRVNGNATVNVTGGHVRFCVYGGGNVATVGQVDEDGNLVPNTGLTTVNMSDGEVGPLDWTGLNAYVYGGSKGIESDPTSSFRFFCNVNNTIVSITENAKVWGSIFGGGSDGHVLADAQITIDGEEENLIIGTSGLTSWDGNIFGGGRNYLATNFSSGRVGGNIHVNITGGTMYGSVYGGGRLASVGVDEYGNAYTEDPDDHGQTYVTITGGIVGFPDLDQGVSDNIRGYVFGGCKGIVRRPQANSVDPSLISNVINTYVVITENAVVKGSVFGGAEDGHVLGNTNVTISGGTIGDDETVCSNRYHGNVYGGGRGIDRKENGEFSNTAGTVNGNTLVTITGGHINRNVYGGGFLASVGLRDANTGDPDPNTGWARVKISGGVIGTDANEDIEHGNVFGSCRGVAGTNYQNYAYVNNALVTLTTSAGITPPVVKGSVFGSGEDGHVLINTQVTINGGQVGVDGVDNPYKGNVYGGGRGIDLDSNGNLSPTAGLVIGNTKVSVQNGVVYGNVFGGGNASSVGGDRMVDILSVNVDPVIHGNVFGGSRAVPNSIANAAYNKGLKTVNVRGGHIMGNVYGCSYSFADGDPSVGLLSSTSTVALSMATCMEQAGLAK